MDEPSWGETAVEGSSSNSSSGSSSSETDDGGETEELSQFEDPFKMFPVTPVNSHTSTTSSEKSKSLCETYNHLLMLTLQELLFYI